MSENGPPRDHVVGDSDPTDDAEDQSIEHNVKSRSTWLRLLFMIVFLAIWGVSRLVILAVVIFQFFCVLFTGRTNARLLQFSVGLATYSYQIILYLTYNSETQPFPFADWPGAPGNESDIGAE